MSSPTTASVELELHPSLWAALERCGVSDLERRIEERVAEFLRSVGISSTPDVALRAVPGERAVRAFVAGEEQAFPPVFLARLWFSVAPRRLRDLAFDSASAGKDGGHAWLVAASSKLAEGDRAYGRRALCDLVEHLAVEVVSLRPGRLLSEEQAVEYLGPAGSRRPAADATTVLRWLLELGVSLCARDRARSLVLGAIDLGRSTNEICEESFAVLSTPEIEVLLDADTFDSLVEGENGEGRVRLGEPGLDSILVEAMNLIRALRLSSLGADVPVVFVRAGDVEGCEMRIKINDRVAPPVPLPAPGEVGVSAPPSALEEKGIRARGLVDPVTGAHLSAAAEERSDELTGAGFHPVHPSAYLVGAFGRAVMALAYRTISLDRVESVLARFEQEFPALVHATLARYTLAELTRLLRELVRERVPIDDLWRILNALALFAEVDGQALSQEERLDAALARVRLELADRIVLNSCGLAELEGGTALVYETRPEVEARVETWRRAEPTGDDLCAARAAVWNAFAGPGAQVEPVILTSPAARPLLRKALNFELPDVHVLAHPEIPPEVTVQRTGFVAALPDA